jgi:hypothetical protein
VVIACAKFELESFCFDGDSVGFWLKTACCSCCLFVALSVSVRVPGCWSPVFWLEQISTSPCLPLVGCSPSLSSAPSWESSWASEAEPSRCSFFSVLVSGSCSCGFVRRSSAPSSQSLVSCCFGVQHLHLLFAQELLAQQQACKSAPVHLRS